MTGNVAYHIAVADAAEAAAAEAGVEQVSVGAIPRTRLPEGDDAAQLLEQLRVLAPVNQISVAVDGCSLCVQSFRWG